MELAIVDLARRMVEAFHAEHVGRGLRAWVNLSRKSRRAWVAAAIVARPDLVEGIAVPPHSWLAGVLPVAELYAETGVPCGSFSGHGRRCVFADGHGGDHRYPDPAAEAG